MKVGSLVEFIGHDTRLSKRFGHVVPSEWWSQKTKRAAYTDEVAVDFGGDLGIILVMDHEVKEL